MVVFMTVFGRRAVVALQKLPHSLFPLQLHWTLWIHFLHRGQFVIRNSWQVPDEMDQFPAFFILVVASLLAESGHPGQSDTVFDDVVKLAIA